MDGTYIQRHNHLTKNNSECNSFTESMPMIWESTKQKENGISFALDLLLISTQWLLT